MLKNMKLRMKFMTVFLAVGIVPFATLGVISKVVAGRALEAQAYRQLVSVREMMKKEVMNYFDNAFQEMNLFSRSMDVMELFNLMTFLDTTDMQPDGPFDVSSQQYREICAKHGRHIVQFWKERGYADIYIVCPDHGHVLFSCLKDMDLGSNLKFGPYKDSGLAVLWNQVVETRKPTFIDFRPYAPAKNLPLAFVGYPVVGNQEKLIGIIAFALSTAQIDAITNQRDGMGKTEITYLVGPDRLMRSDPPARTDRFGVRTAFANPETGRLNTEAVRDALSGKTGEKLIRGFADQRVLSAYSPLKIQDLNWAIISEIDEDEANASIYSLQWIMGTVSVLGAGLIVLAAFLITRSIIYPIKKSTCFAKRISEGDFTELLEMDQKDEIGVLSTALNTMVLNLRKMIGRIVHGVETLSASSTELSAISRQMLTNASHTYELSGNVAAASEEMSANMASVAAATEQASNNVNMVAAASEEMTATITEISRNAEKARNITHCAVEDALNISRTVDELGKAAREIGKVTEVIADISDQTNMLALNATIEAARAGDAGRGFVVVANEIKELARQTAQSTDEIKDRIEGIQNSTSGTVSQIQQITKIIQDIDEIVSSIATAVEEQSITTNNIAGNVSQAARGIHETTQNVSQSSSVALSIAREIVGVNQAGEEISSNSSQVSMSADELKQLANDLKEMVEIFKLKKT